ncbi:unnamed protein product [Bemisia tabaci]|uniref:C2H2-type domain-containing protein n=1 Tax=Bemisia tabaci TaxID=7038 RepID=A0A9P0ACL6_BEMTA|nr:unnamed protein product [Bemisia tabaci]
MDGSPEPSPNSTAPGAGAGTRYDCTLCGASYKHLRNLRAHLHLHSGLTKCKLCNKVLCNRSYYRKHMKQQHGVLIKEERGADEDVEKESKHPEQDIVPDKDTMVSSSTSAAAKVTISPAKVTITPPLPRAVLAPYLLIPICDILNVM